MRSRETAENDQLANLPVKGGFRLRGMEMTRIETFVDAAFAFAVTLLVISIDQIPSNYAELIAALQEIPAFAISFALIMLFWSAHWAWSRRFGLEDVPSVLLSMGMVFIILCYVYPLKYLSALGMHWLSGGRISSGASVDTLQQLHAIFAIYGSGFVATCAIIALLNAHALRCADALRLNRLERFGVKAEIGAWTIVGGVGVLSTLIALLAPPTSLIVPGWLYASLALIMPVYGAITSRREKRIAAEVEKETR